MPAKTNVDFTRIECFYIYHSIKEAAKNVDWQRNLAVSRGDHETAEDLANIIKENKAIMEKVYYKGIEKAHE